MPENAWRRIDRLMIAIGKLNVRFDMHGESSPALERKQPIIKVLNAPLTRPIELPAHSTYFDHATQTLIYEPWDLALKIRFINMKCKATTSTYTRQGEPCAAPPGLYVFKSPVTAFSSEFFTQLEELFANTPDDVLRDRGDDGRASNLIFFSSKPTQKPTHYGHNIEILKTQAPAVGGIMELYAQGVRQSLNATQEQLDECSMSIVRYDKRCGIRQHIDNIAGSLGFEVGPLVSIAVGEGEKYLDMLPTVTNDNTLRPVRITVNQGDVIVMDGPARLEWSHSVPTGHSRVMYSLLLKFKTLNKIEAYRNSYLDEMMYYSIAQ
jgi:alkylated DNA repair dioxygenase AlkB